MHTPEQIAEIVIAEFGTERSHAGPERVEAVMRPIGAITTETERRVQDVLRARGASLVHLQFGCWVEANIVTGLPSDDREKRIRFLLMDTCTCVLDHLPNAVEHAPGPVDARALELLKHPHLTRQKTAES